MHSSTALRFAADIFDARRYPTLILTKLASILGFIVISESWRLCCCGNCRSGRTRAGIQFGWPGIDPEVSGNLSVGSWEKTEPARRKSPGTIYRPREESRSQLL